MRLIILFSVLIALTFIVNAKEKDNNKWWKNAVIYQLYVRSFKDTNSDGVGDIQGISYKMKYLKDAGVSAILLSSIYKSPQVNGGYDVTNLTDINYEYGTIDNFKELIETAQSVGLKVLLDFIPNHTSDTHDWFLQSCRNATGYEDYYVWANGMDNGPPNNWTSVYNGSAWSYNSFRRQYYLHQLHERQPDLNLKNPIIIKYMKDAMKFWIDMGVYGFRLDSISYLYETGMKDEPLSDNRYTGINVTEYDLFDHIYTKDQPGSYEILRDFRMFIDKYNKAHANEDERILIGSSETDIKKVVRYYQDKDTGAHISLNFELIDVNSNSTARDVVMRIQKWMTYMPTHVTHNWMLGNQDKHRVATRVGGVNVDGYNMLVAMLPGIQLTYYGEEIGMEDGIVSFNQARDFIGKSGNETKFYQISRDFERTPYQWDSTQNSGFSTTYYSWLPVSRNYYQNNLAKQKQEKNSHFNIYRQMNELRRSSKILQNGRMEIIAYSDDVLVLRRYLKYEDSIYFIFNMGDEYQFFNLEDEFEYDGKLKIIVSNQLNMNGYIISSTSIALNPHECFVAVEIY